MIKGETSSGFKYEIDPAVLKDYRLLKICKKVDKGDLLALEEMVEKILGEKQAEVLEDHLENEQGIVDYELVMNEMMEIFNDREELKNS